ncbi:MAG: putative type II secretion system protein F [Synergistetes bacterium ADurb.Bin520]|nr:MAG: putative type II secretion system protein F [Synergistetes bacterium ADurb.Bin520]
MEAGIPLVQALEMAAPLDRNPERWKAVADLVRQGHRFAAALEKEGPVTEDVVYMIRVGEMGNDLPEALRNAAENAWEVAQARMERLANLAGPALILLLGSGVGFVVVAVLLPIFDISALVK